VAFFIIFFLQYPGRFRRNSESLKMQEGMKMGSKRIPQKPFRAANFDWGIYRCNYYSFRKEGKPNSPGNWTTRSK